MAAWVEALALLVDVFRPAIGDRRLWVGCKLGDLAGEFVGMPEVIGIEKGNQVSLGDRQSLIAGGRGTLAAVVV